MPITYYTEDDLQDAFDDGYLDGVYDARQDPSEADSYIRYLITRDEAWDELDEAYESQLTVLDRNDPYDYAPSEWSADDSDDDLDAYELALALNDIYHDEG